ncbi:hypothetical protein E3N88_31141 [Mikania micrantha]|uniref:Uncharacterized protein n=1 Tax=Mikania micrantha TaxID=192012 RepID=A0A5N6MQW0_9ASTR|nr:hypothetical protein E3N88_31141 [Mikania micrantha]
MQFREALQTRLPEKFKKRNEGSSSKSQVNNSPDPSLDGYESSDVLVVTRDKSNEELIMDSGCSYHMTPHKTYFSELLIEEMGTVQLGDDRPCTIQGQGTVILKLMNGEEVKLTKVRYIPELSRNLISLGTFEKEGFCVSLKNGKAKVIKGSLVIMTGSRGENNIYKLDGCVQKGVNSVVQGDQEISADLWHRRLGHISNQGLMELRSQGVLGKLESNGTRFCEHCVLCGDCCEIVIKS